MTNPNDDLIDLKALVLGIWGRKWRIAACVAIAWGIAAAMVLKKPRRYASQAQFIFKSGERSSSLASLASMAGFGGLGSKGPDIGTYYEAVLFSDELLSKVVNRRYADSKGDSVRLDDLWKMDPADTAQDGEYRRTKMRIGHLKGGKYVLATKNKVTGVIALKTSFEDPQVARQVGRHILALLEDHLRLDSKSQARENRRFIQERLEEVRRDLRKSEDAYLAFSQANLNPTSPRLLIELGRIKRETSLNQELFLELKKQLELAKIEELKDNPLLDLISSPDLALRPERRGLGKSLVLGTGLGLLAGISLAVLGYWYRAHFGRAGRNP